MDETRNLNHFSERLEKDTYTKDEVAGLLHSEAQFSTRTATKNMVARDEYDTLQSQFNETSETLGKYQDTEFKAQVANEFKNLNGNVDRLDDLVKLTGVNKDMSTEDITTTISSFKEKEGYEFLFNNSNSGGVVQTQNETPQPKITSIKDFTPSSNGGFLNSLFNKK